MPENPNQFVSRERTTTNDFGLQLKRINKTLRKQYEIDSDQDGLVVTRIDRNGEAFQKGIREGDLVKRVGTEKVESINEFNRLVEKSKSKGTVLLLVKSLAVALDTLLLIYKFKFYKIKRRPLGAFFLSIHNNCPLIEINLYP